jgi:hypothetical protein
METSNICALTNKSRHQSRAGSPQCSRALRKRWNAYTVPSGIAAGVGGRLQHQDNVTHVNVSDRSIAVAGSAHCARCRTNFDDQPHPLCYVRNSSVLDRYLGLST